jgi:hypothetical protein
VKVEVVQGSVVIEVVLALMTAAKAYKGFIEMIDWYGRHLSRVIGWFLEDHLGRNYAIGGWSVVPGPAALQPPEGVLPVSPGRWMVAFLFTALIAAFAAYVLFLFFG